MLVNYFLLFFLLVQHFGYIKQLRILGDAELQAIRASLVRSNYGIENSESMPFLNLVKAFKPNIK